MRLKSDNSGEVSEGKNDIAVKIVGGEKATQESM